MVFLWGYLLPVNGFGEQWKEDWELWGKIRKFSIFYNVWVNKMRGKCISGSMYTSVFDYISLQPLSQIHDTLSLILKCYFRYFIWIISTTAAVQKDTNTDARLIPLDTTPCGSTRWCSEARSSEYQPRISNKLIWDKLIKKNYKIRDK